MIAMYDLEDNYITSFDNYKECANYFETSRDCISSYFSKNKKEIIDKKWDKKDSRYIRLFKIEDEECR